jgi:hypothetical protein
VHFAPVSIGIQAEITDGDLALVRNMGSDPGDEFRIIHVLHLFRVVLKTKVPQE